MLQGLTSALRRTSLDLDILVRFPIRQSKPFLPALFLLSKPGFGYIPSMSVRCPPMTEPTSLAGRVA